MRQPKLSKAGSKLDQPNHPLSYRQVEALLNSKFRTDWRNPLCLGGEEDSIQLLNHAQQAVISWLRTEQCWLLAHLFRRGLPPTLECPCGTSAQTPEHFLQSGPNLDVLGSQTWPSAVGSMKSCGISGSPSADGRSCAADKANDLVSLAWEHRRRRKGKGGGGDVVWWLSL